ncbi:hypothetical protein PAMP_015476 [Pampus punctatissimus]
MVPPCVSTELLKYEDEDGDTKIHKKPKAIRKRREEKRREEKRREEKRREEKRRNKTCEEEEEEEEKEIEDDESSNMMKRVKDEERITEETKE